MPRLNANTNYCVVLGITHDVVQGSGTKFLCELWNDSVGVDDLTHSSDPYR